MTERTSNESSVSPSSGFYQFEEDIYGIGKESTWSQAKRNFGHRFSQMRHYSRKFGALLRKLLWIFLAVSIFTSIVGYTIYNFFENTNVESDVPDFSHTKPENLHRKNLASSRDHPFAHGCLVPDTDAPRANASFVMLARNSEVADVVSSMKSMERHFNQWYNYPWVFLNDEEFDENFKTQVRKHTKAEVEFGLVPAEHWNFPEGIDREEFDEWIAGQGDRQIMYGSMESYHKMCRFYSGHFYDHPLVRKREWYWRVEPEVQFFCDLTYDPFVEMEKRGKKYGFTVSIQELYYTAPSLFKHTKAFIKKNNIQVQSAWDIVVKKYPKLVGKKVDQYDTWKDMDDLKTQVERNVNLRNLLAKENKTDKDLELIKEFHHVRNIFEKATDKPSLYADKDDNEEYNLCHFWTNFEIAKTEIFLSKTYQDYFKYLEEAGGFYRERWGDAPVHSIAVAMMLSADELHYFRDIGYMHSTLGHCPGNAAGKQLPYKSNGFEDEEQPWHKTFLSKPDKPTKNGVGCRCSCPPFNRDLENRRAVCIKNFVNVLSDGYVSPQPIDLDTLERMAEKKLQQKLKKGEAVGQD